MVYVDNMRAEFRGMIMCHMMADTTDELLAMAAKIGVNKKWIQYPGTKQEHFDVCLSMKKKAIAAGAHELTTREFVTLMEKRLGLKPIKVKTCKSKKKK